MSAFFAFSATIPIHRDRVFHLLDLHEERRGRAAQAELAAVTWKSLTGTSPEQGRIERALRETEEHFRNAFDYAAIAWLCFTTGRLAARESFAVRVSRIYEAGAPRFKLSGRYSRPMTWETTWLISIG